MLASAVGAAGLAALLFTNEARLLGELGRVAAFWLPLLVLQWRFARGRLARHADAVALAGFFAAAIAAGAAAAQPGRLARHVAQFLVVWLPLLVLVSAPRLAARRRELLLLGASLGACLVVLWLAGPLLMRRVIVPRYALDVDHRPLPNRGGTNEDGVYSGRSAAEFRDEDFNVVCLGDSFTANPHLPEEERWPSRLERLLQARTPRTVRVANFGWVSSSPVLEARRLRDIGAKYKPDLVVQAFDMTDFHDDLRARERLARMGADGDGEVSIFRAFAVGASLALGVEDYGHWLRERWRGAAPERSPVVPGQRYFFLFGPPEAAEPYFRASWDAILETERLARGLGARYVLVVLPRYQQYDPREAPGDPERRVFPPDAPGLFRPFAYFDRQARTVGFPVRSLREDFLADPAFPKCRDDDPHWNGEGNRVAAEAVSRHLIADGLAP